VKKEKRKIRQHFGHQECGMPDVNKLKGIGKNGEPEDKNTHSFPQTGPRRRGEQKDE